VGGGGIAADATIESGASDGAPIRRSSSFIRTRAPAARRAPTLRRHGGATDFPRGGATPPDLAAAHNAELASRTAGPLLPAFYGVNDTNLLGWIALVGALEPSDAGGGRLCRRPRRYPLHARLQSSALRIAPIAADSRAQAGDTHEHPRAPHRVDCASTDRCRSVAARLRDKTTLLVPLRAGTMTFHGSTVEALMGPPTAALRGVLHSAWPLELSGKASQVYAPVCSETRASSHERPSALRRLRRCSFDELQDGDDATGDGR
jgi:hypothetical protein